MTVAQLKPQQLTGRPIDYAPPLVRARSCPHHGTCESPELCDGYGECKLDHTSVQAPPAPVDLNRLESELSRNRLDEIATLVRSLTYGEMMELAGAVAKIIASRPIEIASLTEEPMASVLHEWSMSRC